MAGCGPAAKGMIWSRTFGSAVASMSRVTWSRITFGPPIGRRSTVSSMTTHSIGALSRVSRDWRSMRSATIRSTSIAEACGIPAFRTAAA